MNCPHGNPIADPSGAIEVCEECQMERDLGLVWRMNRHGEMKQVYKGADPLKVRLGYPKVKGKK